MNAFIILPLTKEHFSTDDRIIWQKGCPYYRGTTVQLYILLTCAWDIGSNCLSSSDCFCSFSVMRVTMFPWEFGPGCPVLAIEARLRSLHWPMLRLPHWAVMAMKQMVTPGIAITIHAPLPLPTTPLCDKYCYSHCWCCFWTLSHPVEHTGEGGFNCVL